MSQMWSRTAASFACTAVAVCISCSGRSDSGPPPLVAADSFATAEDVPLVVAAGQGVLANDSDPRGGSLTARVVTPPAHGTLVLGEDGGFTYTPDPDWSGVDGFTYAASSAAGASSQAAVELTVDPVNDAPVATATTASLDEDGSTTIALGGTDAEDGSALGVTVDADPQHGSLSVSTGAAPLHVVYTPAPDYFGPDAFTFYVSDSASLASPSATVTITVRSVNDAPQATAPAPVSVAEDGTASVLLTGTDVDHAVGTLVVTVDVAPLHGTVSPSSGAAPLSVVYTPAADYFGPDQFGFRLRDPSGAYSAPVTVTAEVDPVNDAPVARDDWSETPAGTAVDVDVLANDSDVDSVGLTVAAVAQASHGAVSTDGARVSYVPEVAFQGVDTFTYQVSDPEGATSTATVTVKVGCCDPIAGCGAVCGDDLGLAPATWNGSYQLIDGVPTVAAWTVDNSGAGGVATLTLWSYGGAAAGWTSETIAQAQFSWAINTITSSIFLDGAEPVAIACFGDYYENGERAILWIPRSGGVWRTPVRILDGWANANLDLVLDVSFARAGGVGYLAMYAIISGIIWDERNLYVARETAPGTWGWPVKVASSGGWGPFAWADGNVAEVLYGSGPFYRARYSGLGWTTTDISSALGLTANVDRGDASKSAGSVVLAPDGRPAMVYSEGEVTDFERIRLARWDGAAWHVETVEDVGLASANGGQTVSDPAVQFQGGQPIVVYTYRDGPSPSGRTHVRLARRGPDATWALRDVVARGATARAVLPVASDYVLGSFLASDNATPTYGWFYGYYYRCAVGTCPPPSCGDGILDGVETDVDCGGGTCPSCPTGAACVANADCATNRCASAACVP